MFKFFAKAGLKRSEEELSNFTETFIAGPAIDNSIFVWRAAIFNYQVSRRDPDWDRCLGSQIGENQGLIQLKVIETNKAVNSLFKKGHHDDVAGLKIWNMTFRSMSNMALQHYGKALWRHIETLQDMTKVVAEADIEEETQLVGSDSPAVTLMNNSVELVKYIPPQFS